MQTAYDHTGIEDDIYRSWEASGLMRADNQSDKEPFTIVLPPPNVTGQLHLGHAAMLAIEDILIRYKRMTGHEVLWLPGTDHAAIATESVVVKNLGLKSREEMDRESFLAETKKFAEEKHDTIVGQTKKMGAWLDWSREAYTLDEARNTAVKTMFEMMYEDGLIERGHRMINWSTGAQSVLSDDELEWEDLKEPFYYIRCGEFIIGTVRPETKCTNSPVIVHPDGDYVRVKHTGEDGTSETFIMSQYLFEHEEERAKLLNLLDGSFELVESMKGKELEGQKFEYDTYAAKRSFFVLCDEAIDMEKGSGAMTISICHAGDDYEIAKRHKDTLKEYYFEKINKHGFMTDYAGPCAGLSVLEARKKSGKIMKDQGLLVGIDTNYEHRVPLCYRSGSIVEPMISPQWFIMVEKEFEDRFGGGKTTLKKQMQEAVRDGHINIIPDKFNKMYFHWIDNLRDWCISRQIWWGHRIPVWYDEDNHIHLPHKQNIICVRHGESEANAQGIVGGHFDAPLTEKGREQAKSTGDQLKDRNITHIIASDLQRASQTAQIIKEAIGCDVEIIYAPEFREIDYGSLSGKPHTEGVTNLRRSIESGEGETLEMLQNRCEKALNILKNTYTDGEILLVAHNSFFCCLSAHMKSVPLESLLDFRDTWRMGNAEVREISIFQDPQGDNLTQDEDTLDTWFSSALWPFSTLGWTNEPGFDSNPGSADFAKFYPNSVLETGWDIIFFWVARMIMFGRYATGQYPFHTVYLHGMVCDEHGKKMSKSKGNGIDPLEVISEVGADAVRLSLVIGSTPGNPIPLGHNKIKGYRNFVNKLWNAGRFVKMQIGDERPNLKTPQGDLSLADRWILSRFSKVASQVATSLENYQISSAGDGIYHFVWNEFCDWYIEASKVEMNQEVLAYVFAEILKLTHPLCPFITENLWTEVFGETFIINQTYPDLDMVDEKAEADFALMQELVGAVRKLRTDQKLNPKDKLKVVITPSQESRIKNLEGLLKALGLLSEIEFGAVEKASFIVEGVEVYVDVPIDEEAEKARREKQLAELEKKKAALEGRLSNPSYRDKAPAALVAQTEADLEAVKLEISKLA